MEKFAEEKRKLFAQHAASGQCDLTTVQGLLARYIIDDPNREQRDATPFLEEGHAVFHASAVSLKNFRRDSNGMPTLVCSDRLPTEEFQDIKHSVRGSDSNWGSPCPADCAHFLSRHHEYELKKGSTILIFGFLPTNPLYGGWHQYNMLGIGNIPKH